MRLLDKRSRVRYPRRGKYCGIIGHFFFDFSKWIIERLENIRERRFFDFSEVARSLEKGPVYGKVGIYCTVTLRAIKCTFAYAFGNKRRDDIYLILDCIPCKEEKSQNLY